MSLKETFTRHRIIIQTLRYRQAAFEEIKRKLLQESELTGERLNITLRTFQRDVQDIGQLYGIIIVYDKSLKCYRIAEDAEDRYAARLFEAFDVFQALKANHEFSEYIEFDTRKPAGTHYLAPFITAIREKKQLNISYLKFYAHCAEARIIEPYLLKEFRRRWYVFAYDLTAKDFRVFGLDRINSLLETGIKFQYPQSVNARELFRDVFGIIGTSADFTAQEILLSFRKNPDDTAVLPNQGEYLKSMPLHPTQKIIKDTPGEIQVRLFLKPNWEFIMEILYYGEYVEVLQPPSLRDKVMARLSAALARYK